MGMEFFGKLTVCLSTTETLTTMEQGQANSKLPRLVVLQNWTGSFDPAADNLETVFPHEAKTQRTDLILRSIWRIFHQNAVDMEIVLDQQDLAGFFNNVEHHRILTSVQFLIHRYVQLQDVSIDSDFSVTTQHAERVQRVFKGRWRRPGSTVRVLQLRDVVPLVGVLLQYSLFTVGGTVFQQTCGASMGSQWAPVLCSIVAVFREWSFVQFLQASSTWIQHALLARYVDNRILLLVNTPLQGHDLNILRWPWFYGRPLELEVVQDDTVLGFRIDPLQRSITLHMRCEVFARPGHKRPYCRAFVPAYFWFAGMYGPVG